MLRTRLAVWGDPIDHTRSPALHGAAYAVLGLDWDYGRRRVDEAGFDAARAGLGSEWRGLSLTMPLKATAWRRAAFRDRHAELTGAVNTYLLADDGDRGFNTDVGGLARALRDRGLQGSERARILGAGSTATSALVALAEIGAHDVEVAARRPEAAAHLVSLGARLGVTVRASPLDAAGAAPVDLTVAALAGGARVDAAVADALAAAGGPLFDVVYGHWPSAAATAWIRRGSPAWDGHDMLVHQALLQVRIFVAGDPGAPLPDEPAVLRAMGSVVPRAVAAGEDMGD